MSQAILLLTALLGVASASLTSVVTHIHAPAQFKAAVLAVFSLASGAVEQAAQSTGHFTWHGFLTASAAAFTAAVVAHKGSLIAFLTGPAGLLTTKVPGGIGGPVTHLPPQPTQPTTGV